MDTKEKRMKKKIKNKCVQEDLDRLRRCREAIEDPETFSIDPHSCREGVEIVIKNILRARQTARCRGDIEEVSR